MLASTTRIRLPMALAVAAILLLSPTLGLGQDSPFVGDRTFQLLNGEISGDAAFETIRHWTQFHRPGNSPGFTEAADYIYEKSLEFGLEDVVRLKQPVTSPAWSASEASIWITSPVLMKVADMRDVQLMLADYSRTVDIETELVDVGNGTSDADYEDIDVAGKVVLASGNPSAITQHAVFRRGAAGIITTSSRTTSNPWDYPDQIPWQRVPQNAPEDAPTDSWFGFVISARQGDELRTLLAGQALPPTVAFTGAEPGDPVRVKVQINATFDDSDMDTEFIEARIRGTEPDLPGVVFTCHIQEEKFSANDDASGCANVLEIGRAIKHLIDAGMIERPRRTLRFWYANEISGPYWYFRTYPEERAKIIANLHQDMVGALQTAGSRVQHIIRSPHHIASYLPDIVQSVGEMVIHGNSGYLAAGQAGSPSPFSRPIYSRLGTRDGYRAEFVPNFNNSDHMVFNDGIIGIPAVGFINWPDPYIHSSSDDLWQIDQTQLKRNAFVIAAGGLYVANAGASDVSTIVAEVLGRGSERLGKDLRVAMTVLAESDPGSIAEAYKTAAYILEAGDRRERRAVASIRTFTDGDADAAHMVDRAVDLVFSTVRTSRNALNAYYQARTGEEPAEIVLSAAEEAADGRVPTNIEDVDTYMGDRPRPDTGLHSLMTFSVWGHVDGQASYLDIYKQVMAEAMVHGDWYYGTVSLDQVAATLDAGLEAGILTVR